ncbi:Peptidoglycan-binding lysin domain protein [Solidesulfovibrio fructosivorans JJ]]|uniref:Peptidoglycan-binding lysin domain protein n=1 Tax=Solidesulfovibrio fructosivorans JJ] TaxID=596151 RepID=E1JYS0_SOLFR|nr:LysM peptidoglycan-binding domain-containing protein [Solidesulfovibrio fructosivorans]EFL50490.1 Peptidoglycan-binding lysin domain protein [Solidesulfovibrio fructosivorans JJ]]
MRPTIACAAFVFCIGLCACSGGDKDSFRNVDHDRNGAISYEELLFVFPDVTPDVFSKLDADGSGDLSEAEYKAFLKGEATAGVKKTTPAPAAPAAPKAQTRPGVSEPPAAPLKGEDVIEIPAPGSEQKAKSKPEKTKKDTRDQKSRTDAARTEPTQYTVQRGDTLTRIAHTFGVTVEDIVRANGNMNPDTLRDGQTLTIPPRQ